MYAEIEQLIKDKLDLQEIDIYEISVSDEDGEFGISTDRNFDLIRDLLLEYYYKEADYTFVCKSLVMNCQLEPLVAIDLLGAVDELKAKNKPNIP